MSTTEQLRTSAGQHLRTVLLGAAGSAVLFSASLAVPFIGFIAGFLAAVPLCYTRLEGGRKTALLATAVAALLVGIGFNPLAGLWFLAQCGLIGLLLPELALRGMAGSRALLWTTMAATLASALVAFVMAATAGQNLLTMAQQEVANGMSQALKLYEQQQGLSPQDLETIKQGLQNIAATLLRILPALGTLNLLLVASISLLFLRRMAIQRGLTLKVEPFSNFRVPDILIWPLIVAGFSMLATTPLITTPALNVLAVLAVLYFCQGLAVLLTMIARTSYAGVLKVMMIAVLLLQPYLAPVVAFIGIFDLWGDFRTPRTKQEENL
ncbi:MAG: YybS family protein [Geobacter sp.]